MTVGANPNTNNNVGFFYGPDDTIAYASLRVAAPNRREQQRARWERAFKELQAKEAKEEEAEAELEAEADAVESAEETAAKEAEPTIAPTTIAPTTTAAPNTTTAAPPTTTTTGPATTTTTTTTTTVAPLSPEEQKALQEEDVWDKSLRAKDSQKLFDSRAVGGFWDRATFGKYMLELNGPDVQEVDPEDIPGEFGKADRDKDGKLTEKELNEYLFEAEGELEEQIEEAPALLEQEERKAPNLRELQRMRNKLRHRRAAKEEEAKKEEAKEAKAKAEANVVSEAAAKAAASTTAAPTAAATVTTAEPASTAAPTNAAPTTAAAATAVSTTVATTIAGDITVDSMTHEQEEQAKFTAEEIKKLFDNRATDGSWGKDTLTEFLGQQNGEDPEEVPLAYAEAEFAKADRNHDGLLNYSELGGYLLKTEGPAAAASTTATPTTAAESKPPTVGDTGGTAGDNHGDVGGDSRDRDDADHSDGDTGLNDNELGSAGRQGSLLLLQQDSQGLHIGEACGRLHPVSVATPGAAP